MCTRLHSLVLAIGMTSSAIAAAAVLPYALDAPIPASLQKMADTERAFAARAAEASVRDAFIEFFADEAIGFEPDPVAARESLRKRPAPTVRMQLSWEPRSGDVASSGDLGYLTGPSETIPPGKPSSFGNYFSVWKRQADGEYRVILDVGARTPSKPMFAPGFTRAKSVPEWKGTESHDQSDASLTRADTTFAQALTKDVAEAYQRTMHETARVLRNNMAPLTTRTDAVAWLRAQVKSMTSTPDKAETASSGDLGYTWGKFTEERVEGTAQSGYYLRVWTRQVNGEWQLVADVTAPRP